MSTAAQSGPIPFPSTQSFDPLRQELMSRLDFYINLTRHWSARYSKIACVMRYAIPMVSAVVTVFASLNGAQATGAMQPLNSTQPTQMTASWVGLVVLVSSVAVTILATYNSAARPMQKYRHFMRYHNKFWKLKMEIRMEIAATPEDKAVIRIREWNSQLHNLVAEFSDGSLAALEPVAR